MQRNWIETLYILIEKSLMERYNQYLNARTEMFDDYYFFNKNECNLFRPYNWIHFFVSNYNDILTNISSITIYSYCMTILTLENNDFSKSRDIRTCVN